MKHLQNYLKKFTGMISREKVLRERMCEAVKLHTGKEITLKEVSVQRDIIFLATHPTFKHIILQKEGEIMSYVNNNSFGFVVEKIQ
jgi:hypothetical protein